MLRVLPDSAPAQASDTPAAPRDLTVPPQRPVPMFACWRCGVPFAWTDDDVLRRCAELAPAGIMTPAEITALSGERDRWLRRLLDAERAAWLAGYAAGDRDGYQRGARTLEAAQPAIARRAEGPTHAELERRRWGPGGRERFGDPRPTDRYPRLRAAS